MPKALLSIFFGFLLAMSSPIEAQDKFDPSQPLGDLIFLALDHGVDSIRQGGPLVPFVMSEVQGKRNLNRFVTEPYEKAVFEAKASIPKLAAQTDRYAIAYDGFITVEGKKYDAIIVHGAERGKGKAYLLAQRYISSMGGKPMEVVGNPAFIGKEDALLR